MKPFMISEANTRINNIISGKDQRRSGEPNFVQLVFDNISISWEEKNEEKLNESLSQLLQIMNTQEFKFSDSFYKSQCLDVLIECISPIMSPNTQMLSLEIFCKICSVISFTDEKFKVFIYYLFEHIHRKSLDFLKQCLIILLTVSRRNKFYEKYVKTRVYITKFIELLESNVATPEQKYLAVNLLISFHKFCLANESTARLFYLIHSQSLQIPVDDNLSLLLWLLRVKSNISSIVQISDIDQVIFGSLSSPECSDKTIQIILDIICQIFRISHMANEFECSIIEKALAHEGASNNVQILHSLFQLFSAISNIENFGMNFLSRLGIVQLILLVVNQPSPLQLKKDVVCLVYNIIIHLNFEETSAFCSNEILQFLINCMEIEDVNILQNIFECFSWILNSQNMELRDRFISLFDENNGWDIVGRLMNNDIIGILNVATYFFHENYIPSDEELDSLDNVF